MYFVRDISPMRYIFEYPRHRRDMSKIREKEFITSLRVTRFSGTQQKSLISCWVRFLYHIATEQSRADFIHKLEIALKECYETEYWLEILYKVNSLQEDVYSELNNKSGTLRRKLIASITAAKKNQSKGD